MPNSTWGEVSHLTKVECGKTHNSAGIKHHLQWCYVYIFTEEYKARGRRTILSASMIVCRRCATVRRVVSTGSSVRSEDWMTASVL